MSVKQPLVSVIIPTYSRPTNLCRAIESVLNQSYSNIEIIVVDDNGRDTEYQKKTKNLLANYINNHQIIYIPHDVNRNGSTARNTGFKFSHGEYIAFLDDDDEFIPTKIELQVEKIKNTSDDVGGCYCNTLHIGTFHNVMTNNYKEGNLQLDVLLMKANFNSSTLLIKRNAYQYLKGFDETFQRHQDWEFLIRFFEKYKILLAVPKCYLLIKRISDECSNIPNQEKAIEYRKYYLDSFQGVIMKYPQYKNIYKCQWMDVLLLLSSDSSKKYIDEIKKEINEYGGLGVKDKMLLLRCRVKKLLLGMKNLNR